MPSPVRLFETAELAALEKLYARGEFACVALQGRRRIGKTTLTNAFCANKKTIYFTAAETTPARNLACLIERVLAVLPPNTGSADHSGSTPDIDNPDALFSYLCEHTIQDEAAFAPSDSKSAENKLTDNKSTDNKSADHDRVVLLIDDFTALAGTDRGFLESLATFLAEPFLKTRLFIILCGASPAMNRFIADKNAPLAGRLTAVITVKALDYYDSACFFPRMIPSDRALLYGITGGIPAYLARIDGAKSAKDNVAALFFERESFFLDEPFFILRQELREPAVYAAILEAVAQGTEKLGELAAALKIKTGMCATYIKPLLSLGLLEKITPLYGDPRKTAYRIRELPMLFYFLFVAPYRSAICAGEGGAILDEKVWPALQSFMSVVFKQMAAEYLARKHHYTVAGRWWGNDPATGEEIIFDPAAGDEKGERVIIAQCRYTECHTGAEAVQRLMAYDELINAPNGFCHALFSKSGFTRQALSMTSRRIGRHQEPLLVDLNSLYA